MNILFLLVPLSFLLAFSFLLLFIRAVKKGQFDHMDS
jgi:cbb3-type cytochrome oxidase maturation protein